MKKEKYLSCSQIGRAAYCPHSVRLETQGVKSSAEARKRMSLGEQDHERFNRDITQDRRCFIATACFGNEDPTTQFFRDFRDKHLQQTMMGRGFISLYYTVSPYLIPIVDTFPSIKSLFKRVLTWLMLIVDKYDD